MIAGVAYATLGLVELHTFRSGVYDLVIFDQVVRGYAEFMLPGSLVKGQWNHIGVPLPIFSDHVSPILALLGPLYWAHNGGDRGRRVDTAVRLAYSVRPVVLLRDPAPGGRPPGRPP
ncbi:hypothetical protein DI270_015870 [Microbispora triticiradicis]|uniref:DUF2079 domain-containing protein n=1 Tax=Microbispora triticiradicis TaxID=2200763 RepID=A0ABX9LJC7_9ACTN|nr:hypothetical protein [Microbispora triticiradicis]RGA04010.1 hypothetical protein DI270_015870 [Microbispora triticiradicis]GLW20201.1 hypothetical protein Mame01_02440 [Microbispora amethystogenes]